MKPTFALKFVLIDLLSVLAVPAQVPRQNGNLNLRAKGDAPRGVSFSFEANF